MPKPVKKESRIHTTYIMSEDLFKGNIKGRGSYDQELKKAQRFYKAAGIDFKVTSELTKELRRVQTQNLILGSHGWGNSFYTKDYETKTWKGADYNSIKNACGSGKAKNVYATGCNLSWAPKQKYVKDSPMKQNVAEYEASPIDTTKGITVFTPGRPGLGKTRYSKEVGTVISPDAAKAIEAIKTSQSGLWDPKTNGYWMEEGLQIPRPKGVAGKRQYRFNDKETQQIYNNLIKRIVSNLQGK